MPRITPPAPPPTPEQLAPIRTSRLIYTLAVAVRDMHAGTAHTRAIAEELDRRIPPRAAAAPPTSDHDTVVK